MKQFHTSFRVQFVKRRGLTDVASVPRVRGVTGIGDQGQFSGPCKPVGLVSLVCILFMSVFIRTLIDLARGNSDV